MTDLLTLPEAAARVERILRGEDIAAPVFVAGTVPSWYGAEEPWRAWLRMWQRMAPTDPRDVAFYQAGAIGWASR